jgi:hypothetical protein
VTTGLATWRSGETLGIAVNVDDEEIKFYVDGSLQYTYSLPSQIASVLTAGDMFFMTDTYYNNHKVNVNFGQQGFIYTPPTNHISLCTQNLPTPTIADGSTAFDTQIWTGNSSSRSITGYSFSTDLVWIKSRSHTTNHVLYDIVRGATKVLYADAAAAEATQSTQLTSFNSDGFSLGTGNEVNQSSRTYVGWAWDGGSSTVSNTDGSVTSNVRANPSAGFSAVTYQSNGTRGASIGHGLNTAPAWVVVKNRDNSYDWMVGHDGLGGWSNFIRLNTNGAKGSAVTIFANTAPTSSVFYVGEDNTVNAGSSVQNYLALCWSEVSGYSKFGSYTGNGSSDGPFVFTGFRVAWLMTKRTDTAENWEIRDSTRNPHNRTNLTLFPHSISAEDTGSVDFDLLSNGFKVRNTNGSTNANGGTYIYMAFAENPMSLNGGLAR